MISSVHRSPTTSSARARETRSPTSPACSASRSSPTSKIPTSSLNEVYTDLDAFNARASGPYFAAFFAEASTYAKGPAWLMRGNLVGEQVPA